MSETVGREHEERIPLFRRIENALLERIADGTWAVGAALPSRNRLCAEFGTTRVTLDKAIQEVMRAGLLHSAKGSGTFVASRKRSAATSALHFATAPRALRLGIVLERTMPGAMLEEAWNDNFYFGPLFQGIRDAIIGQPVIVGQPIEMLYAHLERSDYGRFHRDSGLDGMLLITPSRDDLPTLHQLADDGIVFVAVGISSSDPEDAALPCVDTDNVRGAAEAVRHLLGMGHTRIALVNLATAHSNHYDRLEGYRRAMKAANLTVTPDDLVLFPTYETAQFEDRIEEWLLRVKSSGSLPTAVLASDYMMALTTLRVLRRHNLRVPENISLVSFDDPLSAAHLTPPLTTVRQPVYRLGRRAAQRLLHALQGNSCLQGMEILPTELIIRASTCPLTAALPTEVESVV